MITSFPSLEHLHIVCTRPTPSFDPNQTVCHTNVRSFTTSASNSHILRHFTFPNLHALRFVSDPGAVQQYVPTDAGMITSFLRRSQCPLRELDMTWVVLPMEPLNRFLRSLPKPDVLEHLSLVTAVIADHLAYRVESGRGVKDVLLFPLLKSLHVYDSQGRFPPITLGPLVNYLKLTRESAGGEKEGAEMTLHISKNVLPLIIRAFSHPWRRDMLKLQTEWKTEEVTTLAETVRDLAVTLERYSYVGAPR